MHIVFGGREGRLFQSSSKGNESKLHLWSNLLNPSRRCPPTGLQKHFWDMMSPAAECTGLQRKLWPTLFLHGLSLFACCPGFGGCTESGFTTVFGGRSARRSQMAGGQHRSLIPLPDEWKQCNKCFLLGVREGFCLSYFSVWLQETEGLKNEKQCNISNYVITHHFKQGSDF